MLLCGCLGHAQKLPLSTTSDSASFYYELAWEHVLNHGNYGASEAAFRKMTKHDPDFLVGLSLLGRISEDSLEQRQIFDKVELGKHKIKGDERLLLDVFVELHRLRLIRKENPEKAKTQVKKALELGQKNLGFLGKKYKDESYYQAEFIESVHYVQGPQAALDSLKTLDQNPLMPFLQGYKALLLAKTGRMEAAFLISDELLLRFPRGTVPKPFMVKADLYERKGQLRLAMKFVEKVLEIDPQSVDALRLKDKIKARPKE